MRISDWSSDVCSSDLITAGYVDNPAATQASFGRLDEGGPFLRTGDLGFSTADGFYIVSRLKDVIIVRGRNPAPSDVEQIWSELSGTVGPARSEEHTSEIPSLMRHSYDRFCHQQKPP